MATKKPAKKKPKPVEKVVVYLDAEGDWRWSAKARNSETVADSAESYRNRMYCKKMAAQLFPQARIEFH